MNMAIVHALALILNASNEREEDDAIIQLLMVASQAPEEWMPACAESLQRLFIYVLMRSNAELQMTDMNLPPVLLHKSKSEHFDALVALLTRPVWPSDAWKQLEMIVSTTQDPKQRLCMLQTTLKTLVVPQINARLSIELVMSLLLLGITDVWSAIRKEITPLVISIVGQLASVSTKPTEVLDAFVSQLLHVLLQQEIQAPTPSLSRSDASKHHDSTVWKHQEGALRALLTLFQSIQVVSTADIPIDQVAVSVKGSFANGSRVNYEMQGVKMPQLPRSLAQSTVKKTLYDCLRHPQVSVREFAAQTLIAYVHLMAQDDSSRIVFCQEVISKLNRHASEQELLGAAEAEGLLDVLSQLTPLLPCKFLLKHWKFVFATLERYVVHIASSVRQKSATVVVTLASQSVVSDSVNESVELCLQMLLSLSSVTVDADPRTWQQLEGRLLSLDALLTLIGKNWLASLHLLPKPGSAGSWGTALEEQSTWCVRDQDEAICIQKQISEETPALLTRLNDQLTQNHQTSTFWSPVLTGAWQLIAQAAASSQFELRRMVKQALPGIVRLMLWTDQTTILMQEEPTDSLCVMGARALLVHFRYLQEHADHVPTTVLRGAERAGRDAYRFLLSKDVLAGHMEDLVVQMEVVAIGLVLFPPSSDDAEVLQATQHLLDVLVSNLPTSLQLTGERKPDVALDRALSVSLVRLLPSLVTVLVSLNLPSCSSIVCRTALSWLTTEDMLRWITIDKHDAQVLLLETLVEVVKTCDPNDRFVVLEHLDHVFLSSKLRLSASICSPLLKLYLMLWQTEESHAILHSIHRLIDLLSSSADEKPAPAAYDDWDEDDEAVEVRTPALTLKEDYESIPSIVFQSVLSDPTVRTRFEHQLAALHLE